MSISDNEDLLGRRCGLWGGVVGSTISHYKILSAAQVQRFLWVHSPIHNLFRVARHHLKAIHHRLLRERAFTDWKMATSAC